MILLQALWDGSQLVLFAESSSRYREQQAMAHEPSHPDPSASNVLPHPFAVLAEELAQIGTEAEVQFQPTVLEITLPSFANLPMASPRLVPTEEISSSELRPWLVPGILLNPFEGVLLLTTLHENPKEGCRLDDSVLFWLEATKLTLELLSRGRYIPTITKAAIDFRAFWQIIDNEPQDQERLRVLRMAMPAICRSMTRLGDSDQLLFSFIQETGDHLVRNFLSRRTLVPADMTEQESQRFSSFCHWLESLTSLEPTIHGFPFDIANLETRLRQWANPILPKLQRHQLRTTLRLHSPTTLAAELRNEDAKDWHLEFLIESLDGNEFLPAKALWQGQRGFLDESEHPQEELETLLLRDLGRAANYCTPLREALFQHYPSECYLTTTEAYDFLRNAGQLLDQTSLGVILPSWWNTTSKSLGLRLSISSTEEQKNVPSRPSLLGLNQLMQFSWQFAVGDQLLDEKQLSNLLERRVPLVRIGDTWIEFDQRKIQGTLRFLQSQQKGDGLKVIDALRLGFLDNEDAGLLPVTQVTATGWIEQLLHGGAHDLPVISQPDSFLGELRSYQREGLSWLSFLASTGIGGCLADDMGLGKTVQFLALLLHEKDAQSKALAHEPALLVVPMSILNNWEQEVQRFSPSLSTYLHHGPLRLQGKQFADQVANVDLVITTYSLIFRDEDLFAAQVWSRIALDEAQNIKNLEAKQTKAVRRLTAGQMTRRDRQGILQRLALTGTPLENHLEELWSIFDFLNPGLLGSLYEFRQKFSVPIERYRNKAVAESLNRIIRPFVLRRMKNDPRVINDLPEKIEMDVFTELTSEQAALYRSVLNSMLPEVDAAAGIHRKGLVLATITKLKQICNHPALYLHDRNTLDERSGKLSCLVELLEIILAEGDKALVFTQFAQLGHLLKPFLEERFSREVLFLHGALSKKARDALIDKFQKPEGPPIFLLSLKAGGFGLNLTEANQVIHYDQWWNPAVQDQATDRAHRIGQKRNVQVRKFICKGTLEEKIAQMLVQKKDLAQQVVGSTKNIITQLSTDELRNLLQLSSQYF